MGVLLVRHLSGQGVWEKAKDAFLKKPAVCLAQTDEG